MEPINSRKLADDVRNNINTLTPEDRKNHIIALGQFLGLHGDVNTIAPKIKDALAIADPIKIKDIASSIGIDPSKYNVTNVNKKENVIISDPYRANVNSFTTGNRQSLSESLASPSTPASLASDQTRKARIGLIDASNEIQGQLNSLAMDKAHTKFEKSKQPGLGEQFMQLLQGNKPVANPNIAKAKFQAADAMAKGVNPGIAKQFVNDATRDTAIKMLVDNNKQISEEVIQDLMNQLNQENQ